MLRCQAFIASKQPSSIGRVLRVPAAIDIQPRHVRIFFLPLPIATADPFVLADRKIFEQNV